MQTLTKAERLRSRKTISLLFEKGKAISIHPVKMLWIQVENKEGAILQLGVAVPKKNFKRAVDRNRLKRRMRLESDPTVIYGVKDFNGNLTRKHLQTETPYNTYRIKGLPTGPIANPGRASLEAALYPDDTDYIYFVAKKDHTHYFSTNLKEHNRAVRKYQLGRK